MQMRCAWPWKFRFVSVWVVLLALLVLTGSPAAAQIEHIDELDSSPQPKHQVRPHYPYAMRQAGQMGGAVVEFIVTKEGKVSEPQSVAETDVVFGEEAVKAVAKWTFSPGLKDGQPVNSRMVVPIFFTLSTSHSEELIGKIQAVITGFPPKSPPKVPAGFQYDTAPQPQRYQAPVWPWIDGVPMREGRADVFYGIDAAGRVVQARIVEATNDAFGQAAQAAVECWQFKPAERDGQPVPALGRREVQFNLYLSPDAPELRHLQAIETGPANYAKADELDARPKILVREPARYPMALIPDGPDGSAVIECIIDRTGHVCLPRIVEASREEFGWAAATAASRWRFAPPTVKGQPVDVKVRIPFEFKGVATDAE
jgi:TonB family protein